MPRKKTIIRKTQAFELENDVRVTIDFPVGCGVRWQAAHNAVSITTGGAELPASQPKTEQTVTAPAVDRDTPEIEALKRRLPADPLSGGFGVKAQRPYTSADAFAEAGLEISDKEIEMLAEGSVV